MTTFFRSECSDSCRSRRSELETEIKRLRRDHRISEDRVRTVERENITLRQYQDNQNDTEVLMSALSAMQDKNTHLETSLSAETRVKLDLFSALGEAKRQLEISQGNDRMGLLLFLAFVCEEQVKEKLMMELLYLA